ncbi:MAG: hypothetical protein H0U42_00355 [Thermoleophilaceae bacterium]|nr:hypothetical protein [Thermoleophilaceae bacterium]
MAAQGFGRDVVRDLLEEAAAIGPLAGDDKAFRAAFEAFGVADAKGYQAALKKVRLFQRCRLVCEWMRIKQCVLLCLRLCGPPPDKLRPPDPRRLAEAVVRVTTDEKLVKRLAQIVEKGDRAAFQRFVKEHDLTPFCHFFCHWVCLVRYRLVCHWICRPEILERPDFAAELHNAGHALRLLLERGFDDAVAASEAGDPEKLRAVLTDAGQIAFCHFICEWFCSWRCVLVCFEFCRPFPLQRIEDPVREALDFAQAVQTLRRKPAEIERLVAALERSDAKAFGEHVRRLELGRFCIQLCHWLCFLRCRLFCRISCPPIDTIPLFTHVGQYHVDPFYGDFQADGTTTAGSFAFTSTIPLIGILPDATAVDPVEYRFRVARHPALTQVDVTASMVKPTRIGQLQYWYWNAAVSVWAVGSADYWVNNAGAVATIPQQFGPPLSVPVNAAVKPGGWIEVPRENGLTIGGIGRFVRNADRLVELDTLQFTHEQFDLRTPAPGLVAGDSVPSGSLSEAPSFRILFEARKVLGGAAVNANQLDRIALSNTEYKYTRHTEWAGGDVTTRTVCSLDIAELMPPAGTGCDRLEDELHALFTAYHPYLQSVRLFFEGNAPLPADVLPPISGDEATSPSGGELFDLSGMAPCAYIVWLEATVRLTAGFGLIGSATDTDHIAFCKGKRGR